MQKSTTSGYLQFLMEESLIGGEEAGVSVTAFSNETLEEPYEGPEWLVVPLVFGLIFVVGVVGNGTLIFTVLVNKNMRTTPNVLLVSLAVGDLLLILFSVPFMSTIYTFLSWPFGEVVCKLGRFTVSLSLGVSVFTLTALSAERYTVIVHPMTAVHRSTVAVSSLLHTILVAAGIWLLSVVLALVELVAARVSHESSFSYCDAYPVEWGEVYVTFHIIFSFVVYFALPIVTIAFFYALMARMLIVSTKQMPGEGRDGQALKQVHTHSSSEPLHFDRPSVRLSVCRI